MTQTNETTACSGQLIPDTALSFFSATADGNPSMSVSLAARRAELEIEKSGQSITPATAIPRHVDDSIRASRDTSDRLGLTEPIEALHGEGQTTEQISVLLAPKLDKQMPEQERVQFVAHSPRSTFGW